jgi:hypothetical protein
MQTREAHQGEGAGEGGCVGGVLLQGSAEGLVVMHPLCGKFVAHHVDFVEHQQQRQLRLVQDAARLRACAVTCRPSAWLCMHAKCGAQACTPLKCVQLSRSMKHAQHWAM